MAIDTHIVMIPSPGGPIPTPLPSPFQGQLNSGLVPTVKIAGQPAAVVGSGADNVPAHSGRRPLPGTAVEQGDDPAGSTSVKFGGKFAARNLDPVVTCDDLSPGAAKGQVIAFGAVMVG